MMKLGNVSRGALACVLLWACAADEGGGKSGGKGGGAAGSFGNAETAGIGSGPTAGTLGGAANGGQAGSADDGVDNECGGQTYMAQPTSKLDIMMIYDDSGSTVFLPPFSWEPTKTATKAFVNDPSSAGVGVGMKFFGSNCDPNFYATPDVMMGDLPGHAATIGMALDARIPSADTMTEPALKGGYIHQREWLKTHPESKAIVLLVTDGAPDLECGGMPIGDGSAAAKEAFESTPSIPTYVLGLGNVANIDAIAAAGGTGKAILADPSMGGQAIIDAFAKIRTDAAPLPCEFSIPAGGELTPDLVNLAYTKLGATKPEFIGNVGDAAGCAANGNKGWHYDTSTPPKQILTCSETCTELTSGGTVQVALGCPTVVVE